jgi:single-strand DNA-binding protein
MAFIQIAGHLGADPETRFTPKGQKVTSLRVAVNSRKNNKEKTMWFRVTIWGDFLDYKLKYFKKGSAIVVRGELSPPEIYQDREGNPQISLEITAEGIDFAFGGKKSEDGQSQSHGQGAAASHEEAVSPYQSTATQATGVGASSPSSQEQNFDDDLPF